MTNIPGKKLNKLRCANQAEILRTHQRDDEFIRIIKNKFIDILHQFGKYKSYLPFIQGEIPFKLLYFIFTTGLGNQTLGEEYTGIVQANLDTKKIPSLTARIFASLLECFGEQGVIIILNRLKKTINNPDNKLTPEAIIYLNKFLDKLKIIIPYLIIIHKSLFYIYGRYYSLGRRLAGVDYAKVYGKRPTDGVAWGLRFLGIATLIQCILKIWQDSEKLDNENKLIESINQDANKCQLCLESIPTTTTPCGHLFCWNCLGDWLKARAQCPYCREHVLPSRIVHLMNL